MVAGKGERRREKGKGRRENRERGKFNVSLDETLKRSDFSFSGLEGRSLLNSRRFFSISSKFAGGELSEI